MAGHINNLEKDRIGPLMFRLAAPAVVAQVINTLYSIIDRIYIGHIAEVGDVAIAGLGICFPIIMFVSALSSLVGIGGGSQAAIRMGEGQMEVANRILGSCAALLLLISTAAMVVLIPVREPMLMLFGASENTIGYASDYLTIYLCGTLFVQCSLGLNQFVSTQGFSATSMLTIVIGAIVNIILDPIFIFGLNMGVKGAALATVLAQGVSAAWVVLFLMGKRTKLRLQLKYVRLNGKILRPVVAVGVSPFIMMSTESLVNIAFNSSLKHYGNDLYVGAMAISSSILQMVYQPLGGLSRGAQPIIGFNYGAGNLGRVKKTVQLLVVSSLLFTATAWAVIQLFPGVFVGMFNDNPELVRASVWSLRIYLACLFTLGVQNACQQTFVALGQAKVSLLLALLRKVILLIPLILILPLFLADKIFAIYIAAPVADMTAAVITALVFLNHFPKILARRAAELGHCEDPSAQKD